jgi:site-specific recombinase XerD
MRNLSRSVVPQPHTMKLLLEFTSRRHRKTCTNLTLEDLTADTIRRFLDHLEQVRHNSVPTRNVRLAAIHSFFQYLATVDPRHLLHCQSILAVRFKLATELLRQGASLGEIGGLLGHRSPQTTKIYTKVDLDALRTLALPWPGACIEAADAGLRNLAFAFDR